MKIRFFAALLLAALTVFVFSGCTAHALQQLDRAEDAIENHMDKAEKEIENRIESSMKDPTAQAGQITKDEAVSIALDHAKLEENQVFRLHVALDYDDGHPEYEVDFYHDGWEYDYEIDAETGKITGWDKDLIQ